MEHSLTGIMEQVHQRVGTVTVTRAQYADWQHGFIFDGLRNLSYGQSFCHRFGIRDHILNRSTSGHEKDPYIRKFYVR
jgi:hypothetical protein